MHDDSSSKKKRLRQQLLAARAALPQRDRAQFSQRATEILLDSALWRAASRIGVYLPLKTELDISQIWAKGSNQGRCFCAPRVLTSGAMTFHEFQSNSDLEVGMGGIAQPTENAAEIAVDSIDLFLVPLVGCDKAGNRLGFGKGCYDQTLNRGKGFKLGVGFAVQLQDSVPIDGHDIPINGFLRERGLIFFSR